ncbi:hypothetical protein ECP03022932_0298 [Escherichia coli P0302293.2]|nr:hypothetical protein ECP03022932_0298 [Escherichia coli P0302293.2]
MDGTSSTSDMAQALRVTTMVALSFTVKLRNLARDLMTGESIFSRK